jgi:hypothetical protein
MTTYDPGATSAAPRAWAAEALEEHWAAPDSTEDLHNGGTHLLDLVAAVDHLARGLRHDFTIWDALDEALHRWLSEQASHASGAIDELASVVDEDPLRVHMVQILELLAREPDTTLADVLQEAIRHWTTTIADRLNGGYHWPHPPSRRDFPPPQVT